MKKFIFVIFLCASAKIIFSQNIAVNTTGAAAASTNMFEVTQASTTNNTVGIFATHTGAATNAYAIWAEATGATNKYAIVTPVGGGYTGLGTTTPVTQLHVASKTEANAHYGQYLDAVIQGQEGRLQLIGEDQSWGSATLILSDIFGAADNRHWTLLHRTSQAAPFTNPGNSLNFCYITTTATNQDIVPSASGSEIKMTLLNSGLVGIGTASPSTMLEIKGTGTTLLRLQPSLASQDNVLIFGAASSSLNRAKIYSTGNTGDVDGDLRFATGLANVAVDPAMVIRSSGYVGIGTSSPGAFLDIKGNNVSYVGQLRLSATDYDQISFYNSGALTANATNRLGDIYYDVSNSSLNLENWAGSKYILLNPSGTGNIGIGTTTPTAQVHVSNTGADATFRVARTSGSDCYITSQTANSVIGTAGATDLDIRTSNTPGRIYITSGGNIGIGTTGPSYKMDVSLGDGDGIRMSSTLHATFDANSYENVLRTLSTNNSQGSNKPIGTVFLQGLSAGCTYGSFQILGNASNSDPLIYWRTEVSNSGSWNPWLQLVSYNSSGNVGIGTTTPGGQFELSLDQGRKPSTNTWTTTSDERLKNIDGAYTKGLKEVLQLNPILYHYKNAGKRKFSDDVLKNQNVGFSAQEVQKIFPEAVGIDADGYLNFNMHAILIAYTNAFKEQQKLIDELNAKVTTMEAALKAAGIQLSAEKK
jgi:hypothetical protein